MPAKSYQKYREALLANPGRQEIERKKRAERYAIVQAGETGIPLERVHELRGAGLTHTKLMADFEARKTSAPLAEAILVWREARRRGQIAACQRRRRAKDA